MRTAEYAADSASGGGAEVDLSGEAWKNRLVISDENREDEFEWVELECWLW